MAKDTIDIFIENIFYLQKKHDLSRDEMIKIMDIEEEVMEGFERNELIEKAGVDMLFNLYEYFHIPIHNLFAPLDQD